jgi:hypothetical protein
MLGRTAMRIGLLKLGLATALLVAGCIKSTKPVYSDPNVTVVYKDTANLANVHASHGHFELTMFGKTYSEVRGYIPFYVPIPEKNSILFVTGREARAVVHVVNLQTKAVVQIPAYHSHIGRYIRTNNTGAAEWLDKVDGNKITIHARGFVDNSYRYYLDLGEKKFEREEAEFRDATSGTTNREVYLNGKRSSL